MIEFQFDLEFAKLKLYFIGKLKEFVSRMIWRISIESLVTTVLLSDNFSFEYYTYFSFL